MHNFLFKLKFNSAVRFGFDRASGGLATSGFACHADTLFSALCHEWLNIYGEKEMLRIAETASTGIFLISDMFPWEGSQLYLPKPIVYVERVRTQAQDRVISDRKRLKDLHYIPVTHFKEYIEFLKEGGELSFTAAQPAFEFLNTRAYVGRGQETMPYIVSSWRFKPDSGLYFILRTRDREIADLIEQTLGSLGISGIGGKKSTGLGKFELAEDPIEFSGEFGVYDSDIELGRMMEQQELQHM
jgi:CRISPR-associated protein Csm4